MVYFRILIFICLIFFFPNLTAAPKMEKATFAGGCFWCMEGPFESLPGVISVVAGYSGGKEFYPTYEEVSRGKTGHRESVQIEFDSSKIHYEELLTVFWNQIDPTDNGGQFADRGNQYRTGIFYHNQIQKKKRRKIQTKNFKIRKVFRFDRSRNHSFYFFLSCGRIPPKLLQNQFRTI